jgi:hypothetical protein
MLTCAGPQAVLIDQHFAEWSTMLDEMNRPIPFVFFSICAVVDFVFGLLKWHSVVAGIVAIALWVLA